MPTSAAVGASVCGILACCWATVLAYPMNWIWTGNGLFNCNVTLFTVHLMPGTFVSGANMMMHMVPLLEKMASALESLFNRTLVIDDAAQQFCAPGVNAVFHWCTEWQQVRYASYAMGAFGGLTIISLVLGGGFLYYYSTSHATHTGRMWIRTFFVMAPAFSFLGCVQYTFFTMYVGKQSYNAAIAGALAALTTPMSSWGLGYFLAWTFSFLNFMPLFIHATFFKVNLHEKHGDSEEMDRALAAAAAGQNYGAAQPDSFVSAGGPQSFQTGYQPSPYQAPYQAGVAGTGNPAW